MNKNDTNEEDYPTQDEEHPGLDRYPRRDFPKADYTGMSSNQVRKKKSISLIVEKLNKFEQCHMLIREQDCNTIEFRI